MVRSESPLWNGHVQCYHCLGHQFILDSIAALLRVRRNQVIAFPSFGASACKTKPREEFIGLQGCQPQYLVGTQDRGKLDRFTLSTSVEEHLGPSACWWLSSPSLGARDCPLKRTAACPNG